MAKDIYALGEIPALGDGPARMHAHVVRYSQPRTVAARHAGPEASVFGGGPIEIEGGATGAGNDGVWAGRSKPTIPISHAHRDAAVALEFKNEIGTRLLLNAVEFFVSSDGESIQGGDLWRREVEQAIQRSGMLLVLCSDTSVKCRWVYYEIAFARALGKRIVPLCLDELKPEHLPEPLHSLQAFRLGNSSDLQAIVKLLAGSAGLSTPAFNAAALSRRFAGKNVERTPRARKRVARAPAR